MQQKSIQSTLEELDALEGFIKLGCDLPYGPYVMFTRLANRYPRHFIQFMDKYGYTNNLNCPSTLSRQLSFSISEIDALSNKLELFLTSSTLNEGQSKEFQSVSEKLENLLWIRNFKDFHFTHFIDIDQYTDDEEGLGIESLFFCFAGSTLHIKVTDKEGNILGEQTFPVKTIHVGVRPILSDYLLHYFSEPGNLNGDHSYKWSNVISRQHFLALHARGRGLISQMRTKASILGENNQLIIFCKEQNLHPRPTGSSETDWTANCPSGGRHTIMISTLSNKWGCGYCRKKGGLEELKQCLNQDRRR